MRNTIFIFLLITTITSFGQDKNWYIGIEPSINIANFGEQIDNTQKGFLLFGQLYNYEIYAGVDIYHLSDESAKSFSPELGLKYHFRKEEKLHFYSELNLQQSRWTNGSTYNLNYNYPLRDSLDNKALYRSRSGIVSIMGGIERTIYKFISFTLAGGIGIDHYTTKSTEAGIHLNSGSDKDVYLGVVMMKFSVRFRY